MAEIKLTLTYFEAQVVAEALAAHRRALDGKLKARPDSDKRARWSSDRSFTATAERKLADAMPTYR